MVNRKVLVMAVALMAVAMLTTPVFAIGPWQASDVGKNKNLFELYGGCGNWKGEASGSIVWATSATGDWVIWKWSHSEGLMNNALIVVTLADMYLYGSVDYDNKWIYLSGEGVGDQYMGHGWMYWLFFALGGPAAASAAAASNPNGALWMHNNIQD